jgi:branched-subunit amino acid ABC-type transport system permease component
MTAIPSVVLSGGFDVDPVLVFIVVVMLGFVFFVYLFLRRTLSGFKEGINQGRRE